MPRSGASATRYGKPQSVQIQTGSSVDADELYSSQAKEAIRKLIDQDYADWFAFRFYDMWGGRTHYREDDLWSMHRRHTASLVRYMPGYPYFYPQQNHHVPRPLSCTVLPGYAPN